MMRYARRDRPTALLRAVYPALIALALSVGICVSANAQTIPSAPAT